MTSRMGFYRTLCTSFLLMMLLSVCAYSQQKGGAEARTDTAALPKVDKLGPYHIGDTYYDDLKNLAGFTDDPTRSYPEKDIKAAKIIARNLWNTPTLQRFTFSHNKLVRVSIIFHPPSEWTEERVKRVVAEQWGDPGPKQKQGDDTVYLWQGAVGFIVILPADGGRWMASLVYLGENVDNPRHN